MNRRRLLIGSTAVAALAAGGCTSITHPRPTSSTTQLIRPRLFAVASDPWAIRTWAQEMSGMPSGIMEFESWNRGRTLDTHFAQARVDGMTSFVITWEPWAPVAASLGRVVQYKVQPGYSNTAIAAGSLDAYITRFAKSVAAAGLTVYMRLAHEMNGDWYPWSHDAAAYVAAWRRVVSIFRAHRATNARFVFSINPSPYEPVATWMANIKRYWPGAGYVDQLGTTMINFGGSKETPVAEFAARLTALHTTFAKDALLAEVDTAAADRVEWMTDLRTWVASTPWVSGVVWSQDAQSRGAEQLGAKVGDLAWDVTTDAATRPVLQGLMSDLRHGVQA
jgi:hypothetical protein